MGLGPPTGPPVVNTGLVLSKVRKLVHREGDCEFIAATKQLELSHATPLHASACFIMQDLFSSQRLWFPALGAMKLVAVNSKP